MSDKQTSDDFKTDTYRSPKQGQINCTPAGVRVWNNVCDVRCHRSSIQGINRKRAIAAFWELMK